MDSETEKEVARDRDGADGGRRFVQQLRRDSEGHGGGCGWLDLAEIAWQISPLIYQ